MDGRRYFAAIFVVAAVSLLHAGELTGKVTNAQSGEPLGKVRVAVKGATFAAVTREDGTFRIADAPSGPHVLVVSATGYRQLSVQFGETSTAGAAAPSHYEFDISLFPDNFKRSDSVEVHADIFQSPEWPAVGDMTISATEMQQTSTVLINDPFRSLQSLPGVAASSNNDLFAQFSVMGAPYDTVGIYVDDVLVPNLLHTAPGTNNAPTLSLLTGSDVADLRLLPVAYPVRYADAAGAAVVIRTRGGDASFPAIHGTIGMASSEVLAQGALGVDHKATWLLGGRKSYIGYLEKYFAGTRFSEDGFYDSNLHLTYALAPAHSLSLYAAGGQLGIRDPHAVAGTNGNPDPVQQGNSNLAIGRLGWKWAPSPRFLMDTHAAFVQSGLEEDLLQYTFRGLDHEWSAGINASWGWGHNGILQAGYSLRQPHASSEETQLQPPMAYHQTITTLRQDFYIQDNLPLWHERLRVEGGLRWSKLDGLRIQPVTGQLSMSVRFAKNTTAEASWGKYAQMPDRGGVADITPYKGFSIGFGELPYDASHYLAAIEQRIGERARARVEVFDRQNLARGDFYGVQIGNGMIEYSPLLRSALIRREYSRGIQVLLQRRSENGLSGWIGYTRTLARSRDYAAMLPPPFPVYGTNTPYAPTTQDEPNAVSAFGSYRVSSSVRLSAKAIYGSGFPLVNALPVQRIGPYERLDLRGEKTWEFRRWRMTLYTELLNVTNHYNPILNYFSSSGGQTVPVTTSGVPIIPTAGLGLDF